MTGNEIRKRGSHGTIFVPWVLVFVKAVILSHSLSF